MRFPIRISTPWRPLFRLFGFRSDDSYVELTDDALVVRFGTTHENISVRDIDRVEPRRWPFYFGLGPKLDMAGGVAYVGSLQGVVRVWLKQPHRMNVWGPFGREKARAVTVSLEDADGFIDALRRSLTAAR